jgi:hypothetical protein
MGIVPVKSVVELANAMEKLINHLQIGSGLANSRKKLKRI